ncbi:trans-2-enoyl-CoA reductase-like protein [Eremomyces bilateralis CBS 781.70]|uniref:enoyl-[acyl-carrier-protein] reductase n=1 Tax=Eremomyces bilateralis CBS 781.70 TaxID=1392243 RepID=A0A6G1GB53_9PEZI|nr:trans-2-enoyl-CoA reductase-like protein [Eremomyces bilateralis CBS 781.70]KAF1815140.1 trans-2-enoyl-CoA reductase-like protein [Eremomyces bilateralis CBS 781.70]
MSPSSATRLSRPTRNALTTLSRPTSRSPFSPSLHHHRPISSFGYTQSRALIFPDYGDPASILSLHTHSLPPTHGDHLTLRFLASPINPADINQLQGVYPSKPTFTPDLGTPHPVAVGGNEGVAEVLAVGSGVKDLAKGDWVIMRSPGFGTWRTHAQTTAAGLLRLGEATREGITPAQAGTVSVNPCTAYRMLKDFVELKEGDWWIQNGANSGVGRAAVQLGREWGYRSINVVRGRETEAETEALKAELRELGADVVVTDKEAMERGFGDRVKEWTDGGRGKVRLGLNCVGGKLVTSMAKVLAPDSRVVTYGAMAKQPVAPPAGLQIFRNIGFDGFWVSRWSDKNPVDKEKTVKHVLDLTRQGKFKDSPMEEIRWDWDTKQDTLVRAVAGTLEGYRQGKGIFVFGDT